MIGAWDGSANPTPGSSGNQITEYLYDADGEMTGNIPMTQFTGRFVYDAWGRLITVYDQFNEPLMTLTYDASGSHSAISSIFSGAGYPSYSSVYFSLGSGAGR